MGGWKWRLNSVYNHSMALQSFTHTHMPRWMLLKADSKLGIQHSPSIVSFILLMTLEVSDIQIYGGRFIRGSHAIFVNIFRIIWNSFSVWCCWYAGLKHVFLGLARSWTLDWSLIDLHGWAKFLMDNLFWKNLNDTKVKEAKKISFKCATHSGISKQRLNLDFSFS